MMSTDCGWGIFILFMWPLILQQPILAFLNGNLRASFQEGEGRLWNLYNVTSARFCWSKRVTGPVQIQSRETDLKPDKNRKVPMQRNVYPGMGGICGHSATYQTKKLLNVWIFNFYLGYEHDLRPWSLLFDWWFVTARLWYQTHKMRFLKWLFILWSPHFLNSCQQWGFEYLTSAVLYVIF